jgi:RNA polymerase sigma-70 factor (ECF subfamily)
MNNTQSNTELVTVIYNGEAVEVTREVADFLDECRRDDVRQDKKRQRHIADKPYLENETEDFMSVAPRGFQDELVDKLAMDMLPDALAALPEIQRRRVTAYYYEGLTYREIAARESKDESTIRESIASAIKKLKKHFA